MEHLRPVERRLAVGGFLPPMPELVVQAKAWIAFFTRVRCSKAIGVIASIDEPAQAEGREKSRRAHHPDAPRPGDGKADRGLGGALSFVYPDACHLQYIPP